MDQEQLEKLLGRPLTQNEVDNLDLYLEIATERLEALLCLSFSDEAGARKYETREGYSTVFTDVFKSVSSVTVDGEAVDASEYEARQFDKQSASWYNSLVFEDRFTESKVVEVTAEWGFDSMPADLQLILARMFSSISDENSTDSSVKSQRIDDAAVTFKDETLGEQFYRDNSATIRKYSVCDAGFIKHGKVCRWYEHI